MHHQNIAPFLFLFYCLCILFSSLSKYLSIYLSLPCFTFENVLLFPICNFCRFSPFLLTFAFSYYYLSFFSISVYFIVFIFISSNCRLLQFTHGTCLCASANQIYYIINLFMSNAAFEHQISFFPSSSSYLFHYFYSL